MNDESHPTVPASTRWDKVAVFAAIAALAPIILLAIEAGTAARALAVLSGTKIVLTAPTLFGPTSDTVAWAWVIFFGVLAFVFATDTEPDVRAESEPERIIDQVVPDAEPIVYPTTEPADDGADRLPIVPNMPEAQAWYNQGNQLYGLGRYEEASSRFDKALKLNPRLAGAWAGKGLASNALGRYQDAVHYYDESLRLDPRDPAVWHDKGNTLCALGRFEGALNCFNEALILDSRDARAWHNKGVCLAGLGRPDEAVGCYDKALAIDPSHAVAWRAKAMAEEHLGRIPQAVEAYKQFITLASERDAKQVENAHRHVHVLEAGLQAVTAAGPAGGGPA